MTTKNVPRHCPVSLGRQHCPDKEYGLWTWKCPSLAAPRWEGWEVKESVLFVLTIPLSSTVFRKWHMLNICLLIKWMNENKWMKMNSQTMPVCWVKRTAFTQPATSPHPHSPLSPPKNSKAYWDSCHPRHNFSKCSLFQSKYPFEKKMQRKILTWDLFLNVSND